MNHGKMIKRMMKFIKKYGIIKVEYHRPKDIYYRKGSYVAVFDSEKLDMVYSVGDIDKYHVYKNIVNEIKNTLKKEEMKND